MYNNIIEHIRVEEEIKKWKKQDTLNNLENIENIKEYIKNLDKEILEKEKEIPESLLLEIKNLYKERNIQETVLLAKINKKIYV